MHDDDIDVMRGGSKPFQPNFWLVAEAKNERRGYGGQAEKTRPTQNSNPKHVRAKRSCAGSISCRAGARFLKQRDM